MDLFDYPSIERAVAGCKYVIHAACPNPSKAPKNDAPLVKAGGEGTTSILKAAHAAKVKRVVVTCSIRPITKLCMMRKTGQMLRCVVISTTR